MQFRTCSLAAHLHEQRTSSTRVTFSTPGHSVYASSHLWGAARNCIVLPEATVTPISTFIPSVGLSHPSDVLPTLQETRLAIAADLAKLSGVTFHDAAVRASTRGRTCTVYPNQNLDEASVIATCVELVCLAADCFPSLTFHGSVSLKQNPTQDDGNETLPDMRTPTSAFVLGQP